MNAWGGGRFRDGDEENFGSYRLLALWHVWILSLGGVQDTLLTTPVGMVVTHHRVDGIVKKA